MLGYQDQEWMENKPLYAPETWLKNTAATLKGIKMFANDTEIDLTEQGCLTDVYEDTEAPDNSYILASNAWDDEEDW